AQATDAVQAEIEKWDDDSIRLTVSLSQPVVQLDLFAQLIEAVDLAGFEPDRVYFRDLTTGGAETDFSHLPVMVTTLYLRDTRGDGDPTPERLQMLLEYVRLISYVDLDDLLHRELVRRHHFRLDDTNFIRATAEFIHHQLSFIDRNAYNYDDIFRFLALAPGLSAKLTAEFRARFAPGQNAENPHFAEEFEAAVRALNSGEPDRDFWMRNIFRAAGNFLESIQKTNFFAPEKAALSFRLDPAFMAFYEKLNGIYANAFPVERPVGVFFFFRRQVTGFQVRFAEIARGGWRTVLPPRANNELERFDYYAAAKDELFREVYVLAHTQHLKNKDIYEGGSKMITLLEPLSDSAKLHPVLWQAQRSIFLAFLALINYDDNGKLRENTIVDRLGGREIIEIGPDENMFDAMLTWMGGVAARTGYTLGAGIISGKPDTGFNHKEYGVTSFGVHQYVLKTLDELGIDPTRDEFSIKISGGPSGDVAGNAMKLLLAEDANGQPHYPGLRLIAITDGPAAIFDPNGINRGELKRLLFQEALDNFDREKLGEGGSILYSKPVASGEDDAYLNVRRVNGALQRQLLPRDEFMQAYQRNLTHYADIFIPAGGRPSTINESNFDAFFPNGQPSFRAIVEGANSFITPKARDLIQQRGVWIIKDASANKCGVITSSYEILSGLMLSETEFKQVKEELIKEVMTILQRRACREADWLYRKFRAEKTPMTELTDRLSHEINDANNRIFNYLSAHGEIITEPLIRSHLPQLFSHGKYADRTKRLPVEYRRAITSVELACRLVYAQDGVDLGAQLQLLLTEDERAAAATSNQ
ncbi:MAG: NAD-glutamate dehydrogenase, partial [Victivallales bacterium]|nr:NAD-glutamate dehydrogenase [Victivallales bacterium]